MTEALERKPRFENLSFKDQADIIVEERTPSPGEVIYEPTVQFLDPEGSLTREERGKVIAMGDRTAKSYRGLAQMVLQERNKPPVEVEGEVMDSTSAFYLQYALGARSSGQIAHTSILEQVNVGSGEYGGDPPIIIEGISILTGLRDVCSLRHFGFEAFSSRGGIFPENYWRIPTQLSETDMGADLDQINKEVYESYLLLTRYGLEHYLEVTPRGEGEKLWQYKWRVLNLSLDDARQVTNGTFLNHLSMHPNSALSLREALVELSSHPLPETREIADQLRSLAEVGLPTLMRYTEASSYTSSLPAVKKEIANKLLLSGDEPDDGEIFGQSALIDLEVPEDAEISFLAAFLAKDGEISYGEAFEELKEIPVEEVDYYINKILEGMGTHDKPPKELETIQIGANFILSLGAIYEAIRHRLATHLVGRLTPYKGFTTPEIYKKVGVERVYQEAIRLNEEAYELVKNLGPSYDVFSDYFVARAHLIPYSMRISAYDLFHFIKIRASKSAHPDISAPSYELVSHLQQVLNSIFRHLILKR